MKRANNRRISSSYQGARVLNEERTYEQRI